MAIEEKAKAYDEALEKVVKLLTVASEAYLIHSTGIKKESYLAWREKQKEQKPHTDEEKEYIRTIKSIISDFIRDKKPENLAYYQRIYDWLDGRHVPFSCSHENGKSTEWSEEDENALKYIHELLVFGYTEKFMDAQTAHDMRKWVNEHLRPDTFQNGNSHWKPSEQEKGALRTAIHVLTEERNFPKAASQLQNILDAFNGKESRKDWKPSEEQLPGIEEHGIPGKDFIPVEWVDACEKYGKWKIVQQEQPEVELEKEIIRYQREDMDRDTTVGDVARHFYGLCNHTLEEAARDVYKSWMGGTMDDVRRDMVELGKVLNAIKEEKK